MITANYDTEDIKLDICGHAGYAGKGQDIVCAAVTALAGTLERCMEKAGEGSCEWKDGEPVFTAEGTETLRPCFETVICGLEMLAEEFPAYVEINTSSTAFGGPPVSLRLGHASALTCPRQVIHYRSAATLPVRGRLKRKRFR